MNGTIIPLLHATGQASAPTGWLHSAWRLEPTVVLGVFALIAAYLWVTRPRNGDAAGQPREPVSGGQRAAFLMGALVVLIALSPPLDDWADWYLLSAHMTQHLLLTFAAVPLLMLGMPGWLVRQLLSPRPLHRSLYALTRPVMAFAVSSVLVVGWHLPIAYDAALHLEAVHILQHLSFMLAALLAWWPVIGPMPDWPQLAPPVKCLYLFAESLPGAATGAFITMAATGLYSPYSDSPRLWGISLATDQQVAGLLMWVFTGMLYLAVITGIFLRWASREDAKEGTTRTPRAPAPASH